jgi:hypothetical protein
MVPMSQLWLPILLSAVAVFVVSSLIHMVSPWHKGDFPRMANEDAVLDALRPLAIPPGDYFIPRPADRGDLRSPAFLEKVRRGPVVLMTVMPSGSMSMARNLVGWFLYVIVAVTLAAHVASLLPAGAPRRYVFHEVALVSFAGFVLALWQMSIWYRRSLSITLKATVDGLIYAVITGAIFQWLWP